MTMSYPSFGQRKVKSGSRTSEGETVFMCLRVPLHREHLAARCRGETGGVSAVTLHSSVFHQSGRPILPIIAELAFRALFLHNDKHASA